MKIELTFEEYFKIKALFKACSFDGYRKNIAGVFYDHKKRKLVATDGHIIRIENPPFRKKKSFLIKESYFCLTQSQFKKIYASEFNGVEKHKWSNVKFKINVWPKYVDYPKWEKAFTTDEKEGCTNWFNAKEMKKFSETIYDSGRVNKVIQNVKMVSTGDLSVIKIYREIMGKKDILIGGIMPMRAFSD